MRTILTLSVSVLSLPAWHLFLLVWSRHRKTQSLQGSNEQAFARGAGFASARPYMTLFHFARWARAIALGLAFAAQLPTPALAAAPVAAFFEASRQLETLAQAPQSDLPRLSDPAAAPYLIALTDAQGVLLDPRYEVRYIGALMDICAKTNAVAVAYMLFGAKTSIDSTGDPVQVAQQLRRLATENAYRYQAELGRLNAFNAHCFAVQIPLLTSFMQALKAEEVTDVRRAGLAQARRGAAQMFAGALSSAIDPLVEEENKALPLVALAQSAEVYASSFDLAERARVLTLSMQARAIAAPRFQEAIDRIIAAMRSERCDGLCRY